MHLAVAHRDALHAEVHAFLHEMQCYDTSSASQLVVRVQALSCAWLACDASLVYHFA
jgi:hypothetical protein